MTVFVDTSVWYAIVVPEDPDHSRVIDWLTRNPSDLLTTEYVLDETLTLLTVRGHPEQARSLGTRLLAEDTVDLYYVTESDIRAAWHVFSTYIDKCWSFTDCVSKVVMEQQNITKALSLDDHFRQFGSVTVMP